MWDQRGEVFCDVVPGIQTHQVDQAECCSLRSTDQWTCDRVHIIHAVTILQNEIHGERTRTKCNAVTDEIRRVFAEYNSFAKAIFPKPREKLNNLFISIFGRDDFQ